MGSFTTENVSCGIIPSEGVFGLAERAGRGKLWGEERGPQNTCNGCQGGLGGPKGSGETNQGEEFLRMSEDPLQQADEAEPAALVHGGHRARRNAYAYRIGDCPDRHEGYSCQEGHVGHSSTLHIHSNGAILVEQGDLLVGTPDDSGALDERARMEVGMAAQAGVESFMPLSIYGKALVIR